MKDKDGTEHSTSGCPFAAAFETVPDGEGVQIDELAALTNNLQDKRAQNDPTQDGKVLRGVHAKSHGCVRAEFAIDEDLPEDHCVGLFANPGRVHEAWVRFSNAAVLREDDLKANAEGVRQNGSRGMAVKVMDVEGEMLNLDDGRSNQDFLMVNTPEFAFANVRDYLRLERILMIDDLGADPRAYFIPAILAQLGEPREGEPEQVTAQRKGLQETVAKIPFLQGLSADDVKGTISSAQIVAKIASQPVQNPLQVAYFGAAPFMFGSDRAMQFSAVPRDAPAQPTTEELIASNPGENYLADALGETMGGECGIVFDFMIKLRTAEDENLNIEDATKSWHTEGPDYVKAATITIKPPQTPHADEELRHCEQLAFNPWHSLAAHRPIGGINRLREKVYFQSATHRGADGY